ncbi:MAG TPA: hypothetical protein VF624_09175 [Tepidisphaeraceae bacterium]|jgi:hypothetical protein
MRFARWTFRIAAVYGLLAIVPFYFREKQYGIDFPPEVTHPEFYYGFAGLVVVWQLAFLLIASDPRRYRPLMLIAVGEKLVFFVPAVILHAQNRLNTTMLAAACIDAILGIAFAIAWRTTRSRPA